jgi:hypothetical protein
VRTACRMSASGTLCRRAGSPIRTTTTYVVFWWM